MAMGSMTMTDLQLQAAICSGGRWWSDAKIECPHDYSPAAMLAPFSFTLVDLGGSSAAGGRFNWAASPGAPVDAMVAELVGAPGESPEPESKSIVTYQDIGNPGSAYACSLRYALDCELYSHEFNGSRPFLSTPRADETSVHGLIQGDMYSSRPYCQQESDQFHTIRSTLDLLEDGREMSSNTDWDSVLFPASSVLLKRSPHEPVDETLHHPFVETTSATQRKQQMQFTNEAPFWNPSVSSTTEAFSAQMRHSEYIHELVQNDIKAKSSGAIKCTSSSLEENADSGAVLKKARIETPSPLPTFKVRKEKFGDRITALQQLVSPFGKTDTASVLHEAVDYIKFLHDQVKVLGSPNSTVNGQTQRAIEIVKTNQDLRSRGLCLVPISSTVQIVARENPVDFWPFGFGAVHN